jgi:glycosyltransferase involved in cell wall biosynthesis
MRIAINTRFLLSHKMEGFGWFTFEVVKRMVENHPEHEFIFFFDRKYDQKFIFGKNVTPVVLSPQARHPILFKIWFDYSVTKALKKYKADLFFSPDGYLSLKTKVKQIGVIHDLNFEHYHEDVPAWPRRYLKKYFPLFANKADKIITVSEFSKHDIIEKYGLNPDKITVAHNGGNENFKPLPLQEKVRLKMNLTDGKDYFVYVGALHARKNTDRLFEAFNLFKTNTKSNSKLVVVGTKLWSSEDDNPSFEKLKFKDDIIFTGHLNIEELIKIVASAKALALVSYFEGFGIPLVEAMRCGTPVIAGNLTSLPEVVGEAGLLVDPFDIKDIAKAIERLDFDTELQLDLQQKGLARAKLFSWNRSAKIIWKEIDLLLK